MVREILTDHTNFTGFINSLVFSPNNKLIISAGNDSTIKIWDASTGDLVKTLRDHNDRRIVVIFSPDGNLMVSSCRDKTIKIWDAVNFELIQTLTNHENAILGVVFSPNGKQIVSFENENVMVWEVVQKNFRLIKTFEVTRENKGENTAHRYGMTSIAFSPDGKQIVSSGLDYCIKLCNAENFDFVQSIESDKEVWSVIFHRMASLLKQLRPP